MSCSPNLMSQGFFLSLTIETFSHEQTLPICNYPHVYKAFLTVILTFSCCKVSVLHTLFAADMDIILFSSSLEHLVYWKIVIISPYDLLLPLR